MAAELKIVSTDDATIVELDGKTMGAGIRRIEFVHEAGEGVSVKLDIDLANFSFAPDGYFDEVLQKLQKNRPPEDKITGRKE